MDPNSFEQKIKEYIKQSGLSQAGVARKLSYNPDTFNKWVKGVNRWPPAELKCFCETMKQLIGLNESQRVELYKLAGYDALFIEQPQAEMLKKKVEDKVAPLNQWGGIIDLDPRGLDVIQGYDLWFSSCATGHWQIWHLDPEARHMQPINFKLNDTSQVIDQFVPAISPNGRQIAFAASAYDPERHCNRDLYLANIDGTNVRKLVATRLDEYHPSWSPNGKLLAYSAGSHNNPRCPDTSYGIWVFDFRTGCTHQLTNEGDYDPTWSPNGQYIAYHSKYPSWDIKVLSFNGFRSLPNTYPTWIAADIGMEATSAAWVNDHKIIFASDADGSWAIYESYVSPGELLKPYRKLTNNHWDNVYPRVSTDGKILLWQAYQFYGSGEGDRGTTIKRKAVLYVMDLSKGQEVPLILGVGNSRDGFLKRRI